MVSNIYYTAGNYVDTLSSYTGCDSILYTNLLVNDYTVSFDTISSNSSILWNGIYLTLSGDYSDTLVNINGCDSIAYLNFIFPLTAIDDINNQNKNLFMITNILGGEVPFSKNKVLFYIYEDGTIEKKIIID